MSTEDVDAPPTDAEASKALLHDFDSTTVQRGIVYAREGRVSVDSVTLEGRSEWYLEGSARGSRGEDYAVNATVKRQRTSGGILTLSVSDSACECPVTFECKHAVGLIWMWLFEETSDVETSLTRVPRSGPLSRHVASEKAAVAPPRQTERTRSLPAPLASWLDQSSASVNEAKPDKASREAVAYILNRRGEIRLDKMRFNADGSARLNVKGGTPSLQWTRTRNDPPGYVSAVDQPILMLLAVATAPYYVSEWRVRGAVGSQLLKMAQSTGRLWCDDQIDEDGKPLPKALAWTEPPVGALAWDTKGKAEVQLVFKDLRGDPWQLLATDPPLAINTEAGQIAELNLKISTESLTRLLTLPAPKLDDTQPWRFIADQIAQWPDAAQVPALPIAIEALPRPQGRLIFSLVEVSPPSYFNRRVSPITFPAVALAFDYPDGRAVAYRAVEARHDFVDQLDAGKLVSTHVRNRRAEGAWRMRIPARLQFAHTVERQLGYNPSSEAFESLWALPAHAWATQGASTLAEAQAVGFKLDIREGFPLTLEDIPEPSLELVEAGEPGWFRFALGVEHNGERLDLAPAMARVLGGQPNPEAWLMALRDDEKVLIGLDSGRVVRVSGARVKALLQPILEWFQGGELTDVNELQAKLLPAVNALYKGRDEAAWTNLRDKLDAGASLVPVPAHERFAATLRTYQQHGLAWLSHLRELGMGGVLADDMGLGKTVQTLAHLHREHVADSAPEYPSLIVAPTSVVHNWRAEAARFAPELKVYIHHGATRSGDAVSFKGADLVLTSYPILQRDAELLTKTKWHVVVFDEAQVIKNAKAKTHQAAQGLKARQVIALTGTPMENHLGELWSLMNLLVPGLLGNPEVFNRSFRRPIEEAQNTGRMSELRKRIRPFLLRRTRDEVLGELPEKTEVVKSIELERGQADLYESLRTAIHDDVRKVIAKKGLQQSTIHILDALLKLRQACCDPRLVKLQSAKKIDAQSAKLEWLREHLPAIIEAGHRVLLFSQFTSMLALIEDALDELDLRYVILTGDTEDRKTPIDQFQNGEVPIFLLSLKAGGVGLNLTAADTVIHYDPWWNPAIEAQATARAHRIGQEKPVFVYKLIAKGTLEERMLSMLARKQQLASALLEGGGAALAGLTVADVDDLLAPITELEPQVH